MPSMLAKLSTTVDRFNGWVVERVQPILVGLFQTEKLRATKTAVLAVEGAVLFGIGTTLMQISEWFFAVAVFVFLGVLLFAKSISLEKGGAWLKVFGCIGSILLSAALIAITGLHKPDSEPWSNLEKLWKKPSSQSAATTAPTTRSIPPSEGAHSTPTAIGNRPQLQQPNAVRTSGPTPQQKREASPPRSHPQTTTPVVPQLSSNPGTPQYMPQAPVAPPIQSAYAEVGNVSRQLGALDRDWRESIDGCKMKWESEFLILNRQLYQPNGQINQEAKDRVTPAIEDAHQKFGQCVMFLAGDYRNKWNTLAPQIRTAQKHAIERMTNHENPLTPNQAQQFDGEFNAAMGQANIEPTFMEIKEDTYLRVSAKAYMSRFEALVAYLRKLHEKLGDYPETS